MREASGPHRYILPLVFITIICAVGIALVWRIGWVGTMERENLEKVNDLAAETSAGKFELGDKMPDFTLADADGNEVHLSDKLDGEHFVVVTSHHPDCPCAANCGRLISKMQSEGYDDVTIIGFMSEGTKDEYDLEALEEQKEAGIVTYPVYFDHDKEVMNLLGAERTPEIWVLDKDGTIQYWGAPENTLFPGTEGHRYLLQEAIDALRVGKQPEVRRYEPIGCPIDVDWDEEVIPPGEA